MAALKALEPAGDASTVPFLAETAASGTKGPEQAAARRALGSLQGRAVDDEIVAQLKKPASDAAAGELLRAVADRRIFAAKPAVSASLASPSAARAHQALKTLRTIGTPSDLLPVARRAPEARRRAEQGEAEKTVAALLQKVGNPEAGSRCSGCASPPRRTPPRGRSSVALLPPTATGGAARAAHGARRR